MKILLVCRDNIGDLILTTPLISTLADHFSVKVDILVNSYNTEVLKNNPAVNKLYVYKKSHHRDEGESVIKILLDRVKTLFAIRNAQYDVAIIGKGRWDKHSLHWVKYAGIKKIIALGSESHPKITDLIPSETGKPLHFTENFQRMLSPLGIHSPPGKLVLNPDPKLVEEFRKAYPLNPQLPVIAVQISSRKVCQRWPTDSFVNFIRRISQEMPCQIMLLWSPGSADNARHPGDDEKAAEIIKACEGLPITPISTTTLSQLFAAMSLSDYLVSSDGGAMHVGAGLGKPIVALFGNSDPIYWAPWQVPYRLLQAPDKNVSTLTVDQVFDAFQSLYTEVESSKKVDSKEQ